MLECSELVFAYLGLAEQHGHDLTPLFEACIVSVEPAEILRMHSGRLPLEISLHAVACLSKLACHPAPCRRPVLVNQGRVAEQDLQTWRHWVAGVRERLLHRHCWQHHACSHFRYIVGAAAASIAPLPRLLTGADDNGALGPDEDEDDDAAECV